MSKKQLISAGFLIQSKDKYLLCHASGQGMTKGWGIPKGKQDKGETIFETAIRETFEETNLYLREYSNKEVMVERAYWTTFEVGQVKTVHVFRAYDLTDDAKLQSFPFVCKSLVEGTKVPEINGFKWVTIDEALEIITPSQRRLFQLLKGRLLSEEEEE